MTSQAKSNFGFTLIELIMVIAIIGILASIALPTYQTYVKRSYVANGLHFSGRVKFAVYEFYTNNGNWPIDNAAAELLDPNEYQSQEIKSISVDAGTITITYNSKVINDSTITLMPTFNNGYSWDCTGGTIPNNIRPPSCR
ncbi:pilin [Leucothrix mucor]|uniref:pilin n=1 Tax=Leucothrix mucor TaxID=45248 RepID=UPI0003B4B67B|nr:pilin [Leucothrix mucor]